ncbi:MAG: HGGxSTG domain-containing protein [Syntrophales bacterium]|nr:HGGxSTG domain-containing protein [Syntrophales bacterium]
MDEPQEKRTDGVKNLGLLKNNNPPCDLRLLPRCAAKAKSSGKRCGNPAMRGKRVCWIHGGRSTGPKTREGLLRSKSANLKYGLYTKETLDRRKKMNFLLRDYRKFLSEIK